MRGIVELERQIRELKNPPTAGVHRTLASSSASRAASRYALEHVHRRRDSRLIRRGVLALDPEQQEYDLRRP